MVVCVSEHPMIWYLHYVHPNVYSTEISEPLGPVNIIHNRSPKPKITSVAWSQSLPNAHILVPFLDLRTQYHVGEIPHVSGSGPIGFFNIEPCRFRVGYKASRSCRLMAKLPWFTHGVRWRSLTPSQSEGYLMSQRSKLDQGGRSHLLVAVRPVIWQLCR